MSSTLAAEPSIVRATLRALMAPRRLIPILIVAGPMVLLQWRMSHDPLAWQLGLAMCLVFVTSAPVAWRVLMPDGLDLRHGAVRLMLYGLVSIAITLLMGFFIPQALGMRPTLLTLRSSLIVCCALYMAGGWGLGRDVTFEQTLAHAHARLDEATRQAEQAQLLALRSHLDPHFLFNTLNAIAEWCRQDPVFAERAILRLADLLRGMLAGVKEASWPLSRELELARDLLELHLSRDPNLFELKWHVDEHITDVRVPPMLLLPVIENAVKHGPAAGHRGVMEVSVQRHEDAVLILVENPGEYRGPREGSDGVPTLQKRLALAYEERAHFSIEGLSGRTRTQISLPSTSVSEHAA